MKEYRQFILDHLCIFLSLPKSSFANTYPFILGAKKLPCNHIFHVSCLRSWFQRHQTCPTCRLNVLRTNATGPRARQPAPQQAPPNQAIPPIFAFPAWQPPFFPPVPNANLPNMQSRFKFKTLAFVELILTTILIDEYS